MRTRDIGNGKSGKNAKVHSKIILQQLPTVNLALIRRTKLMDVLAEHLTNEPLVHITVQTVYVAVWMSIHETLACPKIEPNHLRILPELLHALLVIHQRTTHTAQTTLYVKITLLVIIQRMTDNPSLTDKLLNILVSPVQQRIVLHSLAATLVHNQV